MRVRQPDFDFSNTRAHWARNVEFAQTQNAASLGIPALEKFLNRVMAKARKEIHGDDPASVALRADIKTFIKQESCHTAAHEAANAVLVRDGYDRIPELEREIEAHYQRLFETKSLAFLTAYCEGFETLGPASAMSWCGDSLDPYLEGSDPNMEMMFRWHLLEEFEHRHVCYDVFKRIHGGYWMRIYAFFYQLYFFGKYAGKVKKYLLETDRAGMTEAECKASKKREKGVSRMLAKSILGNLLKVLSPSYRPHDLPVPTRWKKVESTIDAAWIKPARTQSPSSSVSGAAAAIQA
ncbi:metal-dependent hydrolase [Croceicoccus naphthovorans]|uniref:Metal-dependent hydrolase n=1 Tax=Croceicoccus naphthovorans TaxID=1348774 RepID=A0A0G3XGZ1_9SPHN|nr:metal-dependent hydrolase [Croceicoccus naphthovorans]AKM09906.1 hypothetical protein AB433_07790 [Croceicoccus naphthovorans]